MKLIRLGCLGVISLLAVGCVVAPVGPPRRIHVEPQVAVVVPAPVVVVHSHRYYRGRW